MKIAEALQRRAEIKKLIAEKRAELSQYVTWLVYKETGIPVRPQEAKGEQLLMEIDTLQIELVELINRINKTNTKCIIDNKGTTLTVAEAIVFRDFNLAQNQGYKNLASTIAISTSRYGYGRYDEDDDIDIVATLEERRAQKEGIDITELLNKRKASATKTVVLMPYEEATNKANYFASEYRSIDSAIQQANWNFELE